MGPFLIRCSAVGERSLSGGGRTDEGGGEGADIGNTNQFDGEGAGVMYGAAETALALPTRLASESRTDPTRVNDDTAKVMKKPERADVLRRARIRREQLAKELARTKMELWETTIEQGVLTNILKDEAFSSVVVS